MNAIADSRLPALVVFLFVLLLLGGCAGTGTVDRSEPTYTGSPHRHLSGAPEIQPNVDFCATSTPSGAQPGRLHDDEYLGVIYEVIDLPWAIRTATREPEDIIEGIKDPEIRLRSLQGKIGRARP